MIEPTRYRDGLHGYLLGINLARGFPETRHLKSRRSNGSGPRWYLRFKSAQEYMDFMQACGSPYEQHARDTIRIGSKEITMNFLAWGVPSDTKLVPRPSLMTPTLIDSFRRRCLTEAGREAFNMVISSEMRGLPLLAPRDILPPMLHPLSMSSAPKVAGKIAGREKGFAYVYVETDPGPEGECLPHPGGIAKIGFSDEENLAENLDAQQRSNSRLTLYCVLKGGRGIEQWLLSKVFRIRIQKKRRLLGDKDRPTEQCHWAPMLMDFVDAVFETCGADVPHEMLVRDQRYKESLRTP